MGGSVYYDCQINRAHKIDAFPELSGWRSWLGHDFFFRVVEVYAPKSIKDDELAILLDLPDIQELNLGKTLANCSSFRCR